MKLIAKIRDYFRKRKAKKQLLTVVEKLNPKSENFDKEYFKETKRKFNQAFGTNSREWSSLQWKNLVCVYGMETVTITEHMTEAEVQRRCNETPAQRTQRMNIEHQKEVKLQLK
jgi:hypothetical protein